MWASEKGQTAPEYVGILAFVVAIVLLVVAAGPGIGGTVVERTSAGSSASPTETRGYSTRARRPTSSRVGSGERRTKNSVGVAPELDAVWLVWLLNLVLPLTAAYAGVRLLDHRGASRAL